MSPGPEPAAVGTVDIPVGEMTLSALAAGPADGRLVLLLHGFPQTSWCWHRVLPALAAGGYRAVAPDQRGYSAGARPEGVAAYAMDRLVADVLAAADWLGGHQVDLVGHDWGALVAWVAAERYPERFRTLTAVSAPHPAALAAALANRFGDQARRSAYVPLFRIPKVPDTVFMAGNGAVLRAVLRARKVPAADAEHYAEALSGPGAMTGALNWYRAVSSSAMAATGPVAVPTMYVWGDGDFALGRQAAEATAAHVTGPYRFEVLEGVGHFVMDEVPERVSGLLLDHLSAYP